MWRGITWGKPIRTGSSFVGLGTHRHRVVFYPISHPDPQTGLSMINWIAEVTMDNSEGWKQSGWFRQVETSDFAHHFDGWVWDWLDVPDLIRRADSAFENPMIDRDPIPTWQDGPVVLMGDAAHPMYPTGSNGGSQAIVDARVLGAAMVEHGVTPAAFEAFDKKLCGPIWQVVLRNRGAGPFGLLNMVDERCGGTFDNIDDVIPPKERAEFMAGYKAAAGFAIEALNKAPRTIPEGARARAVQATSQALVGWAERRSPRGTARPRRIRVGTARRRAFAHPTLLTAASQDVADHRPARHRPGAPIETGRTGEPDAPCARSGRIMVHDSQTLSLASSPRLAFWIWWMPDCDRLW